MQTDDLYSETAFLQIQLQNKSDLFDEAIAHDARLGQVKEIFHEIRILKERLREIQHLSGPVADEH